MLRGSCAFLSWFWTTASGTDNVGAFTVGPAFRQSGLSCDGTKVFCSPMASLNVVMLLSPTLLLCLEDEGIPTIP